MIACLLLMDASAQRWPFRKTDKGPYGTYVLYSQLPELFPNATLEISHSSPLSSMKFNYDKGQGYFIVAPYVDLMDSELEEMKKFVGNGNVLFISTFYLDKKIEDWLDVKIENNFGNPDSTAMFDRELSSFTRFPLGRSVNAYIASYDSSYTDFEVLGKAGSQVNCISFKMGDGYVVLHTQPFMFSNYHLIKRKTKAYTELLFSAMPGPLSKIYWDEYTKGSAANHSDPLKFIKSNPPLWYAFLWALAGLILVVLFSFKRRQRVIPTTTPLVNSSLDMARTVSDMYYFGKRNEVMAKKKIAHWLEYLRTRYNIFTSLPPEQFWNAVELRSGMPKDNVSALRTMVELYRNGDVHLTDHQLIRLNNLIDSFYKS